jgi:VanZ family protein
MLLVATPFVLLQTFLIGQVSLISESTVELWGMKITIVPTIALIIFIIGLIYFAPRLRWRHVAAGAVVILLNALAQQITDYYFDHDFYDLQQNWHYIAYAIFAFFMNRDLRPRGVSLARIMLATYLIALAFSTFDETFQKYLSSRVFDMCDIAKDVWGALSGIVLVHLGGKNHGKLLAGWRKITHRRIRDYLDHPFALLVFMFIFGLDFLIFSSILTDFQYWYYVVIITLGSFALIFLLIHLSQFRLGKYVVAGLLIIGIATQSYFFIKHRNEHIVHDEFGLIVYKGIPIPFFDVMVYPDGMFRLVDKKHSFNVRDQKFLLRRKSDILLIGNGYEGRGGLGFPELTTNQFLYNKYLKKGTQLIIMRTPDACRVFNRLKREGKNVLFVIHSTC